MSLNWVSLKKHSRSAREKYNETFEYANKPLKKKRAVRRYSYLFKVATGELKPQEVEFFMLDGKFCTKDQFNKNNLTSSLV